MNEFKISGTVKKVESMTGGLSMPQGGSGTNDYEKLINKPLVFDSSANFPPIGNVERLYIATNVNKIYYWTGVAYADISGSGGGTDGKSPYIGENGNWFEYNDVLQAWTDTGVKAEGKDGKDGVNGLDGINGIDGIDGTNGIDGLDGKSAYEIAVENGFVGTEIEWLASLDGTDGINGINGVDGKSAYEIALENDFIGTEAEWLASLKGAKGADGAKGDKGDKGDTGANGTDGTNGIDGTDGSDGADGKSAYQVWLDNGNTGTELEFLASLKGEQGLQGLKGDKGDKGEDGADGYTPIKGTDYFTSADIASLGIKPTVTTDISSTTQSTTLTNNTEYRYGTLTSLSITWTTSDIRCSMAFTGGAGVTFSITAGTKIVGTDVVDNVFTPVVNKRYNLGFEYDGINRTMYVSGVA